MSISDLHLHLIPREDGFTQNSSNDISRLYSVTLLTIPRHVIILHKGSIVFGVQK